MTDKDRQDFLAALPVSFTCGDEAITLRPKQFASGSVGWHGQGKMTIHEVRCQVNIICTVVGSKPVNSSPSLEGKLAEAFGGPPRPPKSKKASKAVNGLPTPPEAV